MRLSIIAATALLSLSACAKQEEPAANVAGGEALANDGVFASENVILPGENVTDASLANLSAAPANTY